jgi:hypothetical protein
MHECRRLAKSDLRARRSIGYIATRPKPPVNPGVCGDFGRSAEPVTILRRLHEPRPSLREYQACGSWDPGIYWVTSADEAISSLLLLGSTFANWHRCRTRQ